jgi:integrase
LRIGKLTALQVQRATKRGMLNDGAGLYLQIGEGGSKSWILRYKRDGKSHYFGLGALHTIGLADARQKAVEARRLLLDGKDPLAERRASRAAVAKAVTFREAGEAYIAAHAPGWRSDKHLRQWEQSLANYVHSMIGDMKVDAIGVVDVLRVLTPIWTEKPETANRVRNRIELILDAAKARGLRSGENPAAWRGHLDKLLPPRSKVRRVEHFAAMPYRDVAEFMTELRRQDSVPAKALQFAVLTAARSNEALGARWDEIDLLDRKLWTVSASRVKSGREHRVPLSDPALSILHEMAAIRSNDFVFPGRRGPLSAVMLQLALKRMGREGATVHGFRSAFRDWAGNETHFPREICEQALGHVVGNQVEQAYRRDTALEKRRKLMDAWADFCELSARGQVIPFVAR